MDKAATENPGAMAAVLKLTPEKVEEICSRFDKTYPVNYNSPAQTVVQQQVKMPTLSARQLKQRAEGQNFLQ